MKCPICGLEMPHVGHGFSHCNLCGVLAWGDTVTVPALIGYCHDFHRKHASNLDEFMVEDWRKIAGCVRPAERTPK